MYCHIGMTSLLFSGLHHVINNVMTTRVLTLSAGTSNVMTTSVTTMHCFIEIMSTLKAKSFESHMINRILHEWSFHMKFIKLAEGSFDKFHMK